MLRQILKRQYDPINHNIFFPLAKGSECLLQRMALLQAMEVHRGCVNTVVWDAPGNLLLSGSDDQQLVICDPWERMTKTRIQTAHRANIFSAKFMPHMANKKIISCSGDGIVIYTDIERQEETYECKFTCHASTCYDIITLPDDAHSFLTCGEDDTVRWFDLRIKQQCSVRDCQEDVLLNMGRAVTAVAVNPVTSYHLAVATQDSTIRIYDRRILGTRATDSYLEQSDRALLMRLKPDKMEGKNHRVTSLRYSHTGREVLASYSSDFLYLFDTQNYKEVSLKATVDSDAETNSGPTLKRLRLRGDWSDTGPQALPESELRNQAGDVGQARPTLHATLMQRMTDVLSRMLNDPGTRASVQRSTSESGSSPAPPNPDQATDRETDAPASDSSTQPDSNVQPDSSAQPDSNSQPSASEASGTTPIENSEVDSQPHSPMKEMQSCTHFDANQETGANEVQTEEAPSGHLESHSSQSDSSKDREDGPVCNPSIGEVEDELSRGEYERDRSREKLERDLSIEPESNLVTGPERDSYMEGEPESISSRYHKVDPNIEGLQNRISSLRQGFVEKHQVEPSVNLSYSGQGVASGVISLGVGDEMSRGCSDPSPPQATPSPGPSLPQLGESDHVPQLSQSPGPSAPEDPQSSTTYLSRCPGSKSQPLTTSTSSPAICDMEVRPSSSEMERSGMGQDCGVGSHGARATEMNLGPALDFGDDDSDDESTSARTASARMASAIERAVQRARGERTPWVGGQAEATVPQAAVRQCYKGHRNARTMIKEACFWGDSHVMSGSDCGRVFAWERQTGRLVMLWEADRHVVNCLQPHPTLPVLATSGIDYDVKLWAPTCEEPRFDQEKAREITQRNEALLEETRDTITVPATFMIRMLASLNQIRRGTSFAERWRNRRQARRQGDEDEQGSSAD